MRCLSGTNYGAGKDTQLKIYQALIRSKFDYGCQVYNTACKSLLQKLDTLQHQALRITLRAIKNSPVNSLLVETGEFPLQERRNEFILKYWTNIQKLDYRLTISKMVY